MPSASASRFDIGPIADAVKRISAKTPVGTALRSKQLEALPLALRERAQLSARVESARILSQIQRSLEQNLRAIGDGAVMSRERFAAKLFDVAKEELGDAPREGGLQDIRSVGRARLIYDMQTRQAYGHAQWKLDTDPENLNAAPAQEFFRAEPRIKPREDWPERWAAAGGRVYGGRMIALKTDPVWAELSRFKTPWPPYDYNSGMDVRDVYRDEAESLGLVQPGQRLEATQVQDFNDALETEIKSVEPEMWKWLQDSFGDQIRFTADGKAQWRGSLIKDLVSDVRAWVEGNGGFDKAKFDSKAMRGRDVSFGSATQTAIAKAEAAGKDLRGATMRIYPDNVFHALKSHGEGREKRKDQIPLSSLDIELAPLVWRDPDDVMASRGSLEFRKRLLGTEVVIAWRMGDGKTYFPSSIKVKR